MSNILSRLTGQRNIFFECDVKRRNYMDENRYYVYILQSLVDKKLYIDFTTNLKQRLQNHARGAVISTKNRRYLKLIHYEFFVNKEDTKARENFLKSVYGHQQLKNFLKRTLN